MKIKLLIEKDGKKFVKELTPKLFHALYDLQFMISEETRSNIMLNIEKEMTDIFKLSAEVVDYHNEGKCFKLEGKKFIEVEDKFYHSGKKPEWDEYDN